jgi:hypothetical protein
MKEMREIKGIPLISVVVNNILSGHTLNITTDMRINRILSV